MWFQPRKAHPLAPTSTKRTLVASVPEPTPLSAELTGQLAAFQPREEVTLEISGDEVEATLARVVRIGADGQPEDLGERPIFWVVVRDQLKMATPDVPWVTGVLVQAGRAFRLRPLTAAELKLVETGLSRLLD